MNFLDEFPYDRVVRRVVLGRHGSQLSQHAFPFVVFENVGIRVGRHSHGFFAVPDGDVLVDGPHQCHRAVHADALVTIIPVGDHIGVEAGRPAGQIGLLVFPSSFGRDANEVSVRDLVVRCHVVCHEVADEFRVQRPQPTHLFGIHGLTLLLPASP